MKVIDIDTAPPLWQVRANKSHRMPSDMPEATAIPERRRCRFPLWGSEQGLLEVVR
jgi:hypothetical protein